MAVLPPIVSARRAAREVPPLRLITWSRAVVVTVLATVVASNTIDLPAAASLQAVLATLVR
jgi:hypothetical protein